MLDGKHIVVLIEPATSQQKCSSSQTLKGGEILSMLSFSRSERIVFEMQRLLQYF